MNPRIGPEHRLPNYACLACGTLLDAASGVGAGKSAPEAGDVSICIRCGHIAVFAADLKLRHPTRGESQKFARDPVILKTVLAVRLTHGKPVN